MKETEQSIQDAKDKALDIERQISDLINDFQRETLLVVDDIELISTKTLGGCTLSSVNLVVKLL